MTKRCHWNHVDCQNTLILPRTHFLAFCQKHLSRTANETEQVNRSIFSERNACVRNVIAQEERSSIRLGRIPFGAQVFKPAHVEDQSNFPFMELRTDWGRFAQKQTCSCDIAGWQFGKPSSPQNHIWQNKVRTYLCWTSHCAVLLLCTSGKYHKTHEVYPQTYVGVVALPFLVLMSAATLTSVSTAGLVCGTSGSSSAVGLGLGLGDIRRSGMWRVIRAARGTWSDEPREELGPFWISARRLLSSLFCNLRLNVCEIHEHGRDGHLERFCFCLVHYSKHYPPWQPRQFLSHGLQQNMQTLQIILVGRFQKILTAGTLRKVPSAPIDLFFKVSDDFQGHPCPEPVHENMVQIRVHMLKTRPYVLWSAPLLWVLKTTAGRNRNVSRHWHIHKRHIGLQQLHKLIRFYHCGQTPD